MTSTNVKAPAVAPPWGDVRQTEVARPTLLDLRNGSSGKSRSCHRRTLALTSGPAKPITIEGRCGVVVTVAREGRRRAPRRRLPSSPRSFHGTPLHDTGSNVEIYLADLNRWTAANTRPASSLNP
jgi:hypothetical protein